MTNFDKLLKAAFDAGAERNQIGSAAPDFDEWRASLSGIGVDDPADVIEIGDTVRTKGGRTGIARHSAYGSEFVTIYDPHSGSMLRNPDRDNLVSFARAGLVKVNQ